jgi:hypothetical protein
MIIDPAGHTHTHSLSHPSIDSMYRFAAGSQDQLEHISVIELASYPPDEPASLEALTFRMTQAPDYFLVANTTADHEKGEGQVRSLPRAVHSPSC